MKKKCILIFLFYFFNTKLLAQIQLKNEIELRKKARTEQFAAYQRIIKAGGDKAAIYKACPKPKAWRPEDVTIDRALEWDIVPSYVNSKTYSHKGGSRIMISVLPTKQKGKNTEVQEQKSECDFVTVQFQETAIKKIDRTNCSSLKFQAESFTECKKLLGL